MNRTTKIWPWAMALGTLSLAYTQRGATRKTLHKAADAVADALEGVHDTVDPVLEGVQRSALPAARHTLGAVGNTVSGVTGTLARSVGEGVSNALEWGGKAAGEVAERAGEATHSALRAGQGLFEGAREWEEDALSTASELRARAMKGGKRAAGLALKEAARLKVGSKGLEMGGKTAKATRHAAPSLEQSGRKALMEAKLIKELASALKKQEGMIHDLDMKVSTLTSLGGKSRKSGGFPWGLLLMGAGAYYLYKNPTLVQKAMDTIGTVSPQAQEGLEKAGAAVKDGVQRIQRGENPMDVAKDAGQKAASELGDAAQAAKTEATRAAGDLADKAKDAARDMSKEMGKEPAKPGEVARDLGKDLGKAADKAGDAVKDAAGDLGKVADRAGDKIGDAAKDAKDAAKDARDRAQGQTRPGTH